jgi:hypothetical protein
MPSAPTSVHQHTTHLSLVVMYNSVGARIVPDLAPTSDQHTAPQFVFTFIFPVPVPACLCVRSLCSCPPAPMVSCLPVLPCSASSQFMRQCSA